MKSKTNKSEVQYRNLLAKLKLIKESFLSVEVKIDDVSEKKKMIDRF